MSCVLLSTTAAGDEGEELPKDLDLHGSDCIWIRTIRDYTPLSRDSLLIHASGKRSYYVRLLMPGFGLKSSFQLGTRSRDDMLCPYGGDSIIFDNLPGGEVRIRAMTVGADGRIYGIGGQDRIGMSRLFVFDPEAHTFEDLGIVQVSHVPYMEWTGLIFDAMVTGHDGSLYLGEAEYRGKLFIYTP